MTRVKNGRKGKVSKGERLSSMRTRGFGVTNADKMLCKLQALKKGADVKITLENPNKEETNRKFITYKVSGKEYQKYMQGVRKRNPLMDLGG